MWKKIGFIAVVGVAALTLLSFTFGARRVRSYISTACHKFVNGAENEVPLEFEIERLRNETAQLTPDMRKQLSAMAEETVAVETLRQQITEDKAKQEGRKHNILTMSGDLKSGQELISYGDREYSRHRVQDKLAQDLASFDRAEAEIKSKEKLLEAREKSLDALREQLAVMRTKKQELEVKLAELEAKVKTLRLAQSQSRAQIDDTRLAHIQASIAEIENRLKVKEKELAFQNEFLSDPIPVEKKPKGADQLIKEVETRFGPTSKPANRVVAERK